MQATTKLTSLLRDNNCTADKPRAPPSSDTSSCSSLEMATTSSTGGGHIEIETIESMDDDIDPDDNNQRARKLDENDEQLTSAEESELDPLQSNVSKVIDNEDKDAVSQNMCLEMGGGDDETWNKDFDRDSQSPNSRKKGWDLRCFVIGFFVLLLLIGGAAVIILAHRYKGEVAYEFQFARYYGDHMVLQQTPHKAVIWGYGPIITENTTVLVSLERADETQEFQTVVRKTGADRPVWRVTIGPVTHPGPYIITASLENVEGYEIQLNDVLFGDVWVCIEQNKMHLSVAKLINSTDEESTSSSHHQDIRIFSLFPAKSDIQWFDLRGIQLPWTVPKSVIEDEQRGTQSSHSNLHFPGICWLFGKQLHDRLRYPLGLVSVTYSDSTMEEWVPATVYENCGMVYTDSSSRIWNGMIHPMLDMQVFGLIWHQGDLDARDVPHNYNCSLVEFINEWRQSIHKRASGSKNIDLPVGIVQLSPKSNAGQYSYGYSDIRWKQTANFGYLPNHLMPSTFLAVTIDLPDIGTNSTSLHTGHKHDIVGRLLRGALSIAYKRNNHPHSGPFPSKYSTSKGSLTFTFEPPPITVRSNNGFEICCSNNRSHPCPMRNIDSADKHEWISAPISSHSTSSVTLSSTSCRWHVIGVRYAWRESPCPLKGCAIYGTDLALPMPPYIRFGLQDDGVTHTLETVQVDIPELEK